MVVFSGIFVFFLVMQMYFEMFFTSYFHFVENFASFRSLDLSISHENPVLSVIISKL